MVIEAVAFALLGAGAAEQSARAPLIQDLVELTDLNSLSLSPDGRILIFRTERANIARNSYDLEWHSLDTATGAVRDLGSGGDPVYKDPGVIEEAKAIWLPDGRSFAYRALGGGAVGVWKMVLDGSGARPLIVRDADVEQLEEGSGGSLNYTLGPTRLEIEQAERAEYDSGVRVDGSVDLDQDLVRGGSVNGRMAMQRFVGYWFVRAGLLWRAPRQRFRYDLASGRNEPVGKPQSPDRFQPPAVTAAGTAKRPDGSEARARWDGAVGTVAARLRDGPWVQCPDNRCRHGRVAWLSWRPGSDQLLLGFIDRNRRQSLTLWDVAAQHLRSIVSSEGLLSGSRWSYAPCAIGRDSAFCVSASAGTPPRLEQVDFETGARRIVFDPNAGLTARYRPRVEQLSWHGASGGSFHGTLLMRAGMLPKKAPLYVNYYKCDGFLRGGEGDAWPIPTMLDAGFVAVCINAAPFTGAQDAVATYRTGLEGIRSLVLSLARRGLIDPAKVGVGGFSFGSEVATWALMHSRLVAAASIASAQSEPGGYWVDVLGAPDRARMLRDAWHLGSPHETPKRWKLVSPALNTPAIHAPTLMQLPEQEARRIPELAARLIASRTPAELYAFPDEDHVIVQPRHRLAIYERNLDWFRYWLQGYSDPDAAKLQQYQRWDRMRERSQASSAP